MQPKHDNDIVLLPVSLLLCVCNSKVVMWFPTFSDTSETSAFNTIPWRAMTMKKRNGRRALLQ